MPKRKPKEKKRKEWKSIATCYSTCYYYASQQLTGEYSLSEWQPNYDSTYDKRHPKPLLKN